MWYIYIYMDFYGLTCRNTLDANNAKLCPVFFRDGTACNKSLDANRSITKPQWKK